MIVRSDRDEVELRLVDTDVADQPAHEEPRPVSVPERVALFLQVVDGVAAAHGVGVLHKDLKPANVLIAPA